MFEMTVAVICFNVLNQPSLRQVNNAHAILRLIEVLIQRFYIEDFCAV